MLAVVKELHTEISLCGEGVEKILACLRERFNVNVLNGDVKTNDDEELVEIKTTDWWKQDKHCMLAGCRLKNKLTQKQLAELSGIRQNVISEYEKGKRKITASAAIKLAKVLHTKPEQFLL